MLRLVPHGETTITVSVESLYGLARSVMLASLLLYALYQAYTLGRISAKLDAENDATFIR